MIVIECPVVTWKTIMSAVTPIKEEALIVVTQDGAKFKTISSAHNEIIRFFYPKEKMIKFEVDKDEEVQFRVDDMNKIINRFSEDDNLRFEADGKNIKFTSGNKYYELLQMQRDTSATGIPAQIPDDLNIPFKVDMEFTTQELKKMIDDISFVGESFLLVIENNQFFIIPEMEHGKGFGNAKIKLRDIEAPDMKGRYSTEFLANFIKSVSTMIDKASLSFGDTTKEGERPHPIRLKLQVAEVGDIVYYLAAMIKE